MRGVAGHPRESHEWWCGHVVSSGQMPGDQEKNSPLGAKTGPRTQSPFPPGARAPVLGPASVPPCSLEACAALKKAGEVASRALPEGGHLRVRTPRLPLHRQLRPASQLRLPKAGCGQRPWRWLVGIVAQHRGSGSLMPGSTQAFLKGMSSTCG